MKEVTTTKIFDLRFTRILKKEPESPKNKEFCGENDTRFNVCIRLSSTIEQ